MKELNKEEAIKFYDNKIWEKLSIEERGWFQLYQPFLAMPFDKFHEGVEKIAGRPVWTHEFAFPEELKA